MTSKKRIIGTFIFAASLLFILIAIPQTVGLGATGFESDIVLQQFFFYVAPGIGFLIGIILLFIVETLIIKGDKKYGDSLAFNSPGELVPIKFRFLRNPFQLILLSIIIFSVLGLVNVFTEQRTFTGVGVLEQQFSQTESLLFSTALIPVSENLGAAFFLAFTIFLLRVAARKYTWSKQNFVILSVFMGTIVVGIYGLINHLLRYGDSEISLLKVFGFWSAGGFLSVLSGSFIPFWIMHADNNVFFDFARSFSSDSILIWAVIFIVVLAAIYLAIYGFGRKKDE